MVRCHILRTQPRFPKPRGACFALSNICSWVGSQAATHWFRSLQAGSMQNLLHSMEPMWHPKKRFRHKESSTLCPCQNWRKVMAEDCGWITLLWAACRSAWTTRESRYPYGRGRCALVPLQSKHSSPSVPIIPISLATSGERIPLKSRYYYLRNQ